MLEKPPGLPDERILLALGEYFGLTAERLEFLPIGNDASAWAYRAAARSQQFFLKVRRLPISAAPLALARYLNDQGIHEVVAPLPARSGELSQELGAYCLILYPFIAGSSGMDIGLSLLQWEQFGALLRRIHSTRLPHDLAELAPRETFRPQWAPMVRQVQRRIDQGGFSDMHQAGLGAFWQARATEITRLTARCIQLGARLHDENPPLVLCHADIHTANLLVDPLGGLHAVDWDGILLAPRERDLMFVAGRASAPAKGSPEERIFFRGYGSVDINPLVLAYYRYEWVVQELGDYGERVFFWPEAGEETRADAVRGLTALFSRGDVVEEAYRAEEDLV